MRMRKRRSAAAGGLVVAITLSACTQAPGTGGGEANGALTVVCGAQEDWCQALTAAFQRKTGIKTGFVRLSSGEAVARLRASKDSPEFDVMHGGPADGYVAAKQENLLAAYSSPVAGDIPARYKDPEGYWTGVYVGALGFCSNTGVLKRLGLSAPTSWQDLLAPKLAKQVGSAHPATSGTAYVAVWTQVMLHGGDQDAALEYFKKLKTNVLQYSKSGSAPGQQAGRGEIATGVIFAHDCVKFQDEGMTDLQLTYPAEGTGYEVGAVGLIAGARNPDAAKKYIDFALSPEAQEIGPTVKSYQLPTNPKATVSAKSVDLSTVKLIDYDFVAAGDAKKDLVARFDSDIATAPKE
ncbi:ABC transporter substrate-binding protein [Microtetraspora sp. AC03309]|uniref:ABC transporter substrate-binding protein n=1 Tax=Microtetraspora sp. AC03309 TaxID=2779376 RepID=UPI001E4753C1|nr:ABC transporter substrate-binding protein [Microtetraspora sp. AC03309]MCC5575592.1 ABC transporter substrate-binding protein [Microtetraspora sp. AC03309]